MQALSTVDTTFDAVDQAIETHGAEMDVHVATERDCKALDARFGRRHWIAGSTVQTGGLVQTTWNFYVWNKKLRLWEIPEPLITGYEVSTWRHAVAFFAAFFSVP